MIRALADKNVHARSACCLLIKTSAGCWMSAFSSHSTTADVVFTPAATQKIGVALFHQGREINYKILQSWKQWKRLKSR
jgi:hypothetical protein